LTHYDTVYDDVLYKSTFVSGFTIKSLWHLNGEDIQQMYSEHLSVESIF